MPPLRQPGKAIADVSVMIQRRTAPETPRPFRVPWVNVVAPLGILSCVVLMASLPADAWVRLAAWMAVGLAIYFGYGRRNARRV